MKSIKYLILASILLLAGCSVDYNGDFLDSKTYGNAMEMDPQFESTGLQNIGLITIYNEYNHELILSRTYGVSKALEATVEVSESILTEYNELYETELKLLPSQYYTFDPKVEFVENSQTASTNVIIYANKLYNDVGFDKVSDYVLPLLATYKSDDIKYNESYNETLLRMNIDYPRLLMEIPAQVQELQFLLNTLLTQTVEMSGTYNFTGFDTDQLMLVHDKDDVDDYNTANGTSYLPLPSKNAEFVLAADDDDAKLVITGTFNADDLLDGVEYMIPVRVESSVYTIAQSSPIYFIVNIVELQLSITNAGTTQETYASVGDAKSNITVTSNTFPDFDETISLSYDESLIAAYNTANGTNYGTLDASRIMVSDGTFSAGTRQAQIQYSININGLDFDDKYLVPIVLDESELADAQLATDNVVYVVVARSLIGTYDVERINTQRSRTFGYTIWDAALSDRAGDATWDAIIPNAQYGWDADMGWQYGYAMLFNVTNTAVSGYPNRLQIDILTYLEVFGSNTMSDNTSYFDTETDVIYIRFKFYESWCDLEDYEEYIMTPVQ